MIVSILVRAGTSAAVWTEDSRKEGCNSYVVRSFTYVKNWHYIPHVIAISSLDLLLERLTLLGRPEHDGIGSNGAYS